jgi:uncharacterized protein YggE
MRKLSLSILPLALLLLPASPLCAQLPSQTVTVTATQSVSVPPDQALFSLAVTSSVSTNLEQIISPLSGLGITPLNLTAVGNSSATMLQWNFNLAVPLSNLTATIASLTNLEQNITQNNSGLTLTFTVTGVQTSAQAQASQQAQTCTNANLISDATAQAQKLVAAAGVALGPVLRLSTVASAASSVPGLAFAELEPVAYSVPVNYSAPVTCSLTVQFQLLP